MMFNVRLVHALLLSLACGLANATVAAEMPSESKADVKQPSLFDDPTQGVQTANLTVRVVVSDTGKMNATDTMSIHPYPMKPPTVKGQAPKLGESAKDLKYLLLTTGYTSRQNPDKPYPTGGWRWQYAYNEALRKSGLGVPHTLATAYQWVDQMMPFVQRETHRWNEWEKERYHRYQKALEEFEKTRVDVENDAVQRGLYPIDLRRRPGQIARATIPAGNWWLVATRKKPGLTFYWQVPFTAGGGENVNLTLTQSNALIIQGAW